jgi:ABC-type multidrug transport system permease subunit
MRSVEAVQGVMFTTIFPLTFLSNAFAPTDGMGTWLRAVAEWNPISSLVQAVRQLWGNTAPAPESAHLPLHHPILSTVIWTVGLTVLVAPLAIRAFQRRTHD